MEHCTCPQCKAKEPITRKVTEEVHNGTIETLYNGTDQQESAQLKEAKERALSLLPDATEFILLSVGPKGFDATCLVGNKSRIKFLHVMLEVAYKI